MKVELSEQEIDLIVRALNSVSVTGADTMRAVLAVIDKLANAREEAGNG